MCIGYCSSSKCIANWIFTQNVFENIILFFFLLLLILNLSVGLLQLSLLLCHNSDPSTMNEFSFTRSFSVYAIDQHRRYPSSNFTFYVIFNYLQRCMSCKIILSPSVYYNFLKLWFLLSHITEPWMSSTSWMCAHHKHFHRSSTSYKKKKKR